MSNKGQNSPAFLSRRISSHTFDFLLIAFINKIFLNTYINFLKVYFYQTPLHAQERTLRDMPALHLTSMISIFILYFVSSYYFSEGKTVGKLLMHLRVYRPEDLRPLTLTQSFYRTFGYLTCYSLGFILFLMPFLRKDRRGLPDFLSQTQIINEEKYQELLMEKEPISIFEVDSDELRPLPFKEAA